MAGARSGHDGLAEEDGLPTGFQVLAPALADDRVYRVGAALEKLLTDRWGGPLLDRAPRLVEPVETQEVAR